MAPDTDGERCIPLADIDTIREAVVASDSEARPFVDSSPSNGLISHFPYVKRWGSDVGSASWGDTHYYNYMVDCEDHTTYPNSRFVSEHGFQSFPSFEAYAAMMRPEDYSRDSWLLQYRQRHPDGNKEVLDMMARHFHVPPANATNKILPGNDVQIKLFSDYLWLTQLQQARCYETAFSQWRRQRSEPANTMGILYWQLNDIWPGHQGSRLARILPCAHAGSAVIAHLDVQTVFPRRTFMVDS